MSLEKRIKDLQFLSLAREHQKFLIEIIDYRKKEYLNNQICLNLLSKNKKNR